ncbi:hypothetical protein CHS0354_035156 [Potamilus streckersoni]|uniref:Uncharacterized protein n=1 Tax=Potamilus streckersoni TaxID=2493646 RepID=A0AAE0TF47_9BIVA|nr:hypothetical protein CHS0354_035156 [Potamilus streckersoni]
MAAVSTLSQITQYSDKMRESDKSNADVYSSPKRSTSPIFVPPNEFKMKILKRILSVDGNIDRRSLRKLHRHSSERALQASIMFENGDVGTLISIDRIQEAPTQESESANQSLPIIVPEDSNKTDESKKERPLKLPPIILPPIYTVTPRQPVPRDFSGPVVIPTCNEDDWEDLQDCRYLRPAMKKFRDDERKQRPVLSLTKNST